MVIKEKTHSAVANGVVTNIHRSVLRRIPLVQLEDAYYRLFLGDTETSVCADMEIDFSLFQGTLEQALEEALWERGRFSRLP